MINFTSAHSNHVLRVDSVTELESLDAWVKEILGAGVSRDPQGRAISPQAVHTADCI